MPLYLTPVLYLVEADHEQAGSDAIFQLLNRLEDLGFTQGFVGRDEDRAPEDVSARYNEQAPRLVADPREDYGPLRGRVKLYDIYARDGTCEVDVVLAADGVSIYPLNAAGERQAYAIAELYQGDLVLDSSNQHDFPENYTRRDVLVNVNECDE